MANQNISKITRRKIVNELLANHNIFGDVELMEFLSMTWNLENMPSKDSRFDNAFNDIYQHRINNEDYDDRFLFLERLNLIGCDDTTFIKFLETIVSPDIRDAIEEQYELAEIINSYIQHDSYKLEHVRTYQDVQFSK